MCKLREPAGPILELQTPGSVRPFRKPRERPPRILAVSFSAERNSALITGAQHLFARPAIHPAVRASLTTSRYLPSKIDFRISVLDVVQNRLVLFAFAQDVLKPFALTQITQP